VAKEYLETSQSDIQWRDRFWQVTEDTTPINFASELGKEYGSFAAGALSNKIADKYMEEMVETSLSLNDQEKLNAAIFEQTDRDLNIDPDSVRGTGVVREYVPQYMKIKRIEFAEEIRDVNNDNIDVFVENEDGYTYTVSVGTPQDLLEEMKQEKTNFVQPGTIMIIVKKLTEEIVREAIHA